MAIRYAFNMVRFLIILLISFSISAKSADTCSSILNENEMVNRENVRNQDSVGWCYAFAAADLLSYRLKAKISAVSLYNSGQSIEKELSRDKGNGGDIGWAIRDYLSKNNSLCLEEDLPSNDFKFCTSATYFEFLNLLYESVKDPSLMSNQCFQDSLKSAFPKADYNMLKNYTDKYGKKNLAEYLMDMSCKKQSFKNVKINPVNQFSPRVSPSLLLKKIDALLEKGDIVGIASKWGILADNPDKNGDHASIVVGRRTSADNGECEYLIRNSWGKSCDETEAEGLTCDLICEGPNCRYTGYLWVSATRMNKALFGITYLP